MTKQSILINSGIDNPEVLHVTDIPGALDRITKKTLDFMEEQIRLENLNHPNSANALICGGCHRSVLLNIHLEALHRKGTLSMGQAVTELTSDSDYLRMIARELSSPVTEFELMLKELLRE